MQTGILSKSMELCNFFFVKKKNILQNIFLTCGCCRIPEVRRFFFVEKLFSTREVGEFRSMVDQISALRSSISKLDRMLSEKFVSGCKKKRRMAENKVYCVTTKDFCYFSCKYGNLIRNLFHHEINF